MLALAFAVQAQEVRYRVFPLPVESPAHATPPAPADGRVELVAPWNSASPFGWHDEDGIDGTDSTATRGNNVWAFDDRDGKHAPDDANTPDCGVLLDCRFALDLTLPPEAHVAASVVNLFYLANRVHDVAYVYGFDEASGNFQNHNYGAEGLGGDAVLAAAQDGSGRNNAHFQTPPDGEAPLLRMKPFDYSVPSRDSALDNGIVVHELGHGISNRLVGGPDNVSCLTNAQQPGEGLSDWWTLFFTQPDAVLRHRSVGTYAMGQPVDGMGLRSDYYDGDPAVDPQPWENLWTYESVASAGNPHQVGEKWTQAYWEVTWALIDAHGYEPQLDHFTGTKADAGNLRAMFYIIEGLKNARCNPAFTHVRDGVIAATIGTPYEGEDTCLVWRAFAAFGLGSDARGSPSSIAVLNGFGTPLACDYLGAEPNRLSLCAGDEARFAVTLGDHFVPPVTMGLTGLPGSASHAFEHQPMLEVPGPNPLIIGNTGELAEGRIDLVLTAEHGGEESPQSLPLALDVFVDTTAAPTLLAPIDGALDADLSPKLRWNAVASAERYIVEVASDANFEHVIFSQTLSADAATLTATPPALASQTWHWWRVRGENACGAGADSPVFRFRTKPAAGECAATQTPRLLFADDAENGERGWSAHAGVGTATWALSTDRPHSGKTAWLAVDVSALSDQYLVSPLIHLPADQTPLSLSFWNDVNLEERHSNGTGAACWDGGMVEISDDNGQSWRSLGNRVLNTPYTGALGGGPGEGRRVWCGTIPYRRTVVDLDEYAGRSVRFRFRVSTDEFVGDAPLGWFVDDVEVQSCASQDYLFEDGFE